jgi:malonate transporter and related proteins
MQPVINVTLPFFALVFCGWFAARRHVLPESAIPGLNAFVLYFALPCLLFRFGMNTAVAQLLNPSVLAVWFVCAALIVAFTIGVTLSRHVRLKDAAFGALVAAFPNSGFMGVPLLVALMGDTAAGPMICAILVDMLFTTSLCVGLAQAHPGSKGAGAGDSRHHDDGGAGAAVKRALKGALSNPMPWAVVAGALFSVANTKLTGPAYTVVSMLADAASPVALFTIGAVLWRAGQHASPSTSARQAPARTPMSRVLPVVAIKLVAHPLLVFAAALAARRFGGDLPLEVITVLVLTAALPSASNVSILAERFGADNGRIARIIMLSTALAFVTFSLLAWVFGVGGPR